MTTWVLVRGWARESRHWGSFPTQLREAIPGAQVIALDLPGTGTLHGEASPASVGAFVEGLRESLRARGAAPPWHLLGVSLGAMACVEWAARHPGEIAACVAINASARPWCSFHERLKPRNYLTLVDLALFQRDPRAREAGILRLTSSSGDRDGTVAALWGGYADEYPVSPLTALRQLVAAARYRAPPSAPPVPLLLLAGGGDKLVDPGCSKKLARAWNAPLMVHPTAGHDLTFDDGPWVAAQVARWLRPS